MNYQDLLLRSKVHLSQFPLEQEIDFMPLVFTKGAKWMTQRLNEIDKKQRNFNSNVAYEYYGYLKYSFCFFCFIMSGLFFWTKASYLSPLSILVFYFFEVHFLFLFPLLIDGVEKPLARSIHMTYKMGIFYTMRTVIPIGFFMVTGLFNWRNPLQNWHIGCLAVLIWYTDEKG
ncbi:hypothetical protein [Lewinella cohaerens]|uniref:hypothetical protein n=1 Tax=Lewinella cohaerens TaxID=70995 RepID=UPI0012EB56D2|nr:hypothetical protein [Lewinella cohaerens]